MAHKKATQDFKSNNEESREFCFYCGEDDLDMIDPCLHCNQVYACGTEHLKLHCCNFQSMDPDDPVIKQMDLPSDKGFICLPYMVDYHPTRGRYLRASRDIEPGETVLIDHPFVQGPPAKSSPLCLQCSKMIVSPDSSYKCAKCSLPLCDKDCEDGSIHQIECKLFSDAFSKQPSNVVEDSNVILEPPDINPGLSPVPFYTCIGPLRLLLKTRDGMVRNFGKGVSQTKGDRAWFRVQQLMDHEKERRGEKSWMLNHILVVVYLQKIFAQAAKNTGVKGGLHFNAQQIQKAIGLLRTNGVKIDGQDASRGSNVGLYPTYSLTNHSCIDCNTRTIKIHRNDNEVVLGLKAILPIKKGEQIYTRYTTPQLGTIRRQQVLQKQWYFACDCKRCKDPTECGSMTNTLVCPKCAEEAKQGFILPDNPIQIQSSWICQNEECRHVIEYSEVLSTVMKIENDISAIDEKSLQSPDEYLKVLEDNANKTVHTNHFLMGMVREKLVTCHLRRRQKLVQMIRDDKLLRDLQKSGKYSDVISEILNSHAQQLEHFNEVVRVMEKIDLPKEFWHQSLQKMTSEFEAAKTLYKL